MLLYRMRVMREGKYPPDFTRLLDWLTACMNGSPDVFT